MKLASPKEHIDSIRALVAEDLMGHQVTEVSGSGPVRCWKCARPGTWMYGFYITVIPGFVFIAGDIGELVFQPTHPDPIDFILQGDLHYQYGKVVEEFRSKRDVLPYLVKQVLATEVGRYRESGEKIPGDLKKLCRDARDFGYLPDDISELYRQLMDINQDAIDISVTVPSYWAVYRIFALQWFGQWLAAQGVKAA